ncbi:MAG: ABC transporter substrate-binding protein [Deltaproteobacteria bacterium]|nr:ABC transporter substrate-binding protein [Deltaproteobacteria bacterium]
MKEILKDGIKTGVICVLSLISMVISPLGCKTPERIFTIGIPCKIPIDAPILDGFRAGMGELGYIEDKNIRYIYSNIPDMKDEIIDAKIKELLARHVDLLLILETEAVLPAMKIAKETDIPVVFSANIKPIGDSLTEGHLLLRGNLTGVRFADTNSKALEWLARIIPGAKKIYLPYNPGDIGSAEELRGLEETALQLGIELVVDGINSVEAAVKAIESLPEDIDAVFRIPSPMLNERNIELSRAAIERQIPMGASLLLDEDVLITLTCDFFGIGRQAARLVHQIHQGIKPTDLPIETSEVFLTVNLKTAQKVGITLSNDALAQAKVIIR